MNFINNKPESFKYCVIKGNEVRLFNEGYEEYTQNDTALIDVEVWIINNMLYISGTCELVRYYLEKEYPVEKLKHVPLDKYIYTPIFSNKKVVGKGFYEAKCPHEVKMQIINPIIKIY